MRVEKLSEEIRDEKDKRMLFNSGIGFVTFVSRLQVNRCLDVDDFQTLVKEKLSKNDISTWETMRWKVE